MLYYNSRGYEQEIASKLTNGQSVVLLGPPGSGKTSTALAVLSLLQKSGIPGVLVKIWFGPDLTLSFEDIRLDGGETLYVPTVKVPQQLATPGELVKSVVTALSSLEKQRKEKRSTIRGLGVVAGSIGDKIGDLTDIGVSVTPPDLAQLLEAAGQLSPALNLAVQSVITVREWLVRRKTAKLQGRVVIAVDDASDLYVFGGAASQATLNNLLQTLKSPVLLVHRVEAEVYVTLQDKGKLRRWLIGKGLVPDYVVMLDPPGWDELRSMLENSLGIKYYRLRTEDINRIGIISGMNPAIAIALAHEAVENPSIIEELTGKLVEKLREQKSRVASHGTPIRMLWWQTKEGKDGKYVGYLDKIAYMYASATDLYEHLRSIYPSFTALAAAYPYPLAPHEIILFNILAMGWDIDEVLDSDDPLAREIVEIIKHVFSKEAEKGWLARLIAKEKGTTTRTVRREAKFQLAPMGLIDIIGQEIWPSQEETRELIIASSTLSSIATILQEASRWNSKLDEELNKARRTLLSVISGELEVSYIVSARMALLGISIIDRLAKVGMLQGLEKNALKVLGKILTGHLGLTVYYKDLALNLLRESPSNTLEEKALLAQALLAGLSLPNPVLELRELNYLEKLIRSLSKEALEKENAFAIIATSLGYYYLSGLKLDPESVFMALDESLRMAYHLYRLGYRAPYAIILILVAGKLALFGLTDEAANLLSAADQIMNEYKGDMERIQLERDAALLQAPAEVIKELLEDHLAKAFASVHISKRDYYQAYRQLSRIACKNYTNPDVKLLLLCLNLLSDNTNVLWEETKLRGCTLPPLSQADKLVVIHEDKFDTRASYSILSLIGTTRCLGMIAGKIIRGEKPDIFDYMCIHGETLPAYPGGACFTVALERAAEIQPLFEDDLVDCIVDIYKSTMRYNQLVNTAKDTLEKLAPGGSSYLNGLIQFYNKLMETDKPSEEIEEEFERIYFEMGIRLINKILKVKPEVKQLQIPGLKPLLEYLKEMPDELNDMDTLAYAAPAILVALATKSNITLIDAVLLAYAVAPENELAITMIKDILDKTYMTPLKEALNHIEKAFHKPPKESAVELLKAWCLLNI
ncbi:MAG: ATP-binding protein [Desulfurococcales archaeon]|nr:ATP-binding protein [Desulfurococcales archaeon]